MTKCREKKKKKKQNSSLKNTKNDDVHCLGIGCKITTVVLNM